MPRYEITGPDGGRYEVTAPEGASEKDVLAFFQKSVGGEDFAARAAGMDPVDLGVARSKNDAFGEYLRTQAKAPKAGETKEQTDKRLYGSLGYEKPGQAEGLARSFNQGLMFGFGDEAQAAAAAALDPVLRKEGMGGTFGERYNTYLASERGRLKQYSDANPIKATAAEIVGAIPTAIATAPASLPASLVGRMAIGAAGSAAQGAAYGFGTGEGGAVDRAANSAIPAALGGVLGAAAPAVGAGARAVGERFATGRAAQDVGVSRPAYNLLTQTLGADDSLTGAGAQRLAAAGPNAMLADAGPNARSMLDTIIQRSGPASREATRAVEGRAAQAGQQINNALDNTFGAPQGRETLEQGIRDAARTPTNDLYTQAYRANPSVESRAVDRILETPAGREALKRAAVTMQNDRSRMGMPDAELAEQVRDLVARGEMDPVKGGVARGLNLRSLDLVKQELWDIAQSQRASDGINMVDTAASRATKGLWRDFVNALDEADVTARTGPNSTRPEGGFYRQARALAQDSAENRAAVRLGTDLLSPSTTRDSVRVSLDGMAPTERAFVARGIRSQIDDTLANVRRAISDPNVDAREAVKAVKDLSSRAAREKVALVIGDDAADTFFGQLDQAATALELRASVAQNSKTFARQSMNEQMQAMTDDGVVNALRSGKPVNAGQRFVQMLFNRTAADKGRIRDELDSEMTRALVGPDGVRLLQQIANLQGRPAAEAERWRRLGEIVARRNPAISAPVSENVQR